MNPERKTTSGNRVRRKKKPSPMKRTIVTVIKIIAILVVTLGCSVTGVIGGAMLGYIKTATPITEEQLQLKNLTTFLYDAEGNEIDKLQGEQNRILVDGNQIPQDLKDAFVAIEDERFHDHPGIDFKRILGAVYNLVMPGGDTYGASTITQQVIKNITGDDDISLRRKVQEQWRALQLEKKLTKDEILELYANLIYMGENCYGVQAAAKTYFDKDVQDLTLAESASLAGITNWPTKYNPLLTEGRKHNEDRQKIILEKMLELEFITQAEYAEATNQELVFNDTGNGSKTSTPASSQSYFVDQVVIDVKKDLAAKYNISQQIALKNIYNNGYKIYTTMDTETQKTVDEIFTNEENFPKERSDGDKLQSAMAIVDPKTGQVRALYGGRGVKVGSPLNRASSSLMKRQPGSSIKPIAVYGPALDIRAITPATVIDDVPVYYNGADKARYPLNDDLKYHGLTTIRDGLRRSFNVVAAKVWMEKLGPEKSLEYLKKVGIDRENEKYVSVAMGGLSEGVNPLQMASAYVAIANKGLYLTPTTYTKVVDRHGNVILENKPATTIVYDEATSYVLTSMMMDVCRSGTAYPYGLVKNEASQYIPTAGKTGTTNDSVDKWFVGFSPYYVGAVWSGFDNNYGQKKGLVGEETRQSLKLWNLVMTKLHQNLEPQAFEEPPGVVRKKICIYSGKSPSELCSKDPRGHAVREEVFIAGTEPKDYDVCHVHVKAEVCKDSKDIYGRPLLFGPYCPEESLEERVFIQRKEEYKPKKPGDPYPTDYQYELPYGEYCHIHGEPEPEPESEERSGGGLGGFLKDLFGDAGGENPTDGETAAMGGE